MGGGGRLCNGCVLGRGREEARGGQCAGAGTYVVLRTRTPAMGQYHCRRSTSEGVGVKNPTLRKKVGSLRQLWERVDTGRALHPRTTHKVTRREIERCQQTRPAAWDMGKRNWWVRTGAHTGLVTHGQQ